jgi:putative FmdB family regulatory protein
VPTYQYACKEPACGHRFEAVQSFSDDPIAICPVCEGQVRKVFSAVGVVFKGSGFYRTDSRENAKSSNGSSSNGSSSNGSSSNGSGEKKSEAASSSSSGESSGSGSSGSASKASASSGSSSGSTSKAAAS